MVSIHDGLAPRRRGRTKAIALSGLMSMGVLAAGSHAPAHATVSSVTGSAFGWKTAVSLFGGPTTTHGVDPADAVVDLPSNGSAVPVTDQAAGGAGQYGPATIYKSGPIAVSTRGEKGDSLRAGYVESSSTATNVGTWVGVMTEDTTGVYQPLLGGEMDPFIATSVSSTCSVSENGQASGTTTITGGRLVDTDSNGNATNVRQVPVNPAPNTGDQGVLAHVGDHWAITYNEQIVSNGGKTIEVNAVHLQLLGPIAVGDMYIGHSVCGYTS
jgi:hypothetical protein